MTSQRIASSFLLCALLALCALPAAATEKQQAVLIVAFGTSVEQARVAYEQVEKQVTAAFPDRKVVWGWSARTLLKKTDPPRLTPQQALAELAAEGIKSVDVLSLHVIPGAEYADLERTVRAFEGLPKGLTRIRLAPPLLHNTESLHAAAKALLRANPHAEDEALLFVGHGSRRAGVYYPALQYYLHSLDPKAFVGCVEGDPDFDAVLKSLKAGSIRKVRLAPLMTVAGDHALNDLFGPEKTSWLERLQIAGIKVETSIKGLGEDPAFVTLWLEGLKTAAEKK